MELGAFSISLAVKDIQASKAFYDVKTVSFSPEQADELVLMWRASFERAVGVRDPHPLEDQRRYLLDSLAPHYEILVVLEGKRVVAFIAASAESIAQLYVHVDYQGRGIGSRLLNWAKARSNGSLWLYTFATNRGAQCFYEKHGFRVAARGFEETWQLDDIRYEWQSQRDGCQVSGQLE